MKNNNLVPESFAFLNANDLHNINGGTMQDSYNAGYEFGVYCRKLIESWKFLKYLLA
jgi:hypothetical protein